ncbi:MAG: ABC transporter substrate-binding protein, partial [Methanophagales archaeon]|nr:ABC transporter substrate-binding protein [Methanophagales archaeon]
DFIQIKLIIVGKEKEITFVDELERGDAPPEVVTIHKPVERIIISSMLDQAEALRSLGAKDKVIGVGETIKDSPVWLPELSKLPYVPQTHTTIDYEAVLTLNPEVLWAIGRSRIDREKLPGVAVIHLRLTSPITFAEGVRKLGYILDKREEAEKLCNWHEGYINKIESRTGGLSEDEKPKVFLWGGYISGGGYQTCNSGRMHEMCDIAGGKNIAEDLELPGRGGPWLKVDSEWVIVQNPDIIVALAQSGCGYSIDDPSEMAALRDDILMNRPELAKITAVKSGSVYMMTFQDFAVGGAGGLLGIAHQAKWFHPDLFVDVDPEAIHQEYVTRFQHLDYDLDKHGVFVYPPLED